MLIIRHGDVTPQGCCKLEGVRPQDDYDERALRPPA